MFDLFRNFLESQVDAAILAYSAGGGAPAEPAAGGKLRISALGSATNHAPRTQRLQSVTETLKGLVFVFLPINNSLVCCFSIGSMDLPSLLALKVAFLNFCLVLFPSRVDYVSQILDSACRLLAATCQRPSAAAAATAAVGGRSPPSLAKLRGPGAADMSPNSMGGIIAASASARTDTSNLHLKPLPETGMEALTDLLAAPLRVLSLQVLSIESYAPLMDFLDLPTRNHGNTG